ncbi:hypothetical protein HAD_07010 [Hyphomonas adhaerens MHS-3]|uniref:Uncharacterized protein n=1 Tax=Hyphomonas adhaerens MHS-3 TaxID=1280949 RepID=A0A069E5N0_9PROT|nr:hypothetical protein [Hyphomonas adhaerens]KCZ85413.1 hypothetical protein HAD_07010 [Hyphomonas adhaerens MHS-3]
MTDLFGYTFPDNLACAVCEHVFAGDRISVVCHDQDGGLQFLCGASGHQPENAKIVGLGQLAEWHDLKVLPALLHPGFTAELSDAGEWEILDTREES